MPADRPDRDALADRGPWRIFVDGERVLVDAAEVTLTPHQAERLAYAILAAVKAARKLGAR